MGVFRRPGWYIALILFALHQGLQYGLGVNIPLIDGYLDPLLCIPIILGGWVEEASLKFGPLRLGRIDVLTAVIVLGLLFEEVWPRWQPLFVRDWWDYLAYALGGLWFWFFVNPAAVDQAKTAKAELQRE